MKNYFRYSYAAMGLLLHNCSNIDQSSFTIRGTITGEDIDKIYLKYGDTMDSTFVSNNSFSFKGIVTKPIEGILYPVSPASGEPMTLGAFMLENSNIVISLKYAKQQSNGTMVKFLDIDSITGSKSQNLKAGFDTEIGRMADIFNKSDNDSLKAQLLYNNLNEFIKENPKSILSGRYLASLNSMYGFLDDKQIENLLNLLDRENQDESDLTRIHSIISQRKILGIGYVAPTISLPNREGKLIHSGKFKENFILIDFWASWCVPCRQQNPELLEIYNSFKGQDFNILGISLDKNVSNWQAAIEEDKIDWIHVIDSTRSSQTTFGISSIPFNLLINKTGEIVLRNASPKEITKTLIKEFGQIDELSKHELKP